MNKPSILNKLKDVYLYAAFFRVAVCLLLLVDFFYSFGAYKYVFSDNFPIFLVRIGWFDFFVKNHYYLLGIYLISLVLYLFGIFRYFGAFFFLLVYSIVNMMFYNINTWGDDILKQTLVFFVFVNSYNYFSLSKTKEEEFEGLIKFISSLGLVCIVLHVFYIYGINIFHKIQNKSWQYGNAISIAILLERQIIVIPFFLKLASIKIFSQIISYTVLLQQLFFIPLSLINKTRPYIIALTFLTHLGIAIIFFLVKFQIIIFLLLGFVLYIPAIKREIKSDFNTKVDHG